MDQEAPFDGVIRGGFFYFGIYGTVEVQASLGSCRKKNNTPLEIQ
jgi:hypothetical protein